MPVINVADQTFPAWCELESFEIVTLTAGGAHTFDRRGQREKLIVARGHCRLVSPHDQSLAERAIVDLDQPSPRFEIRDAVPGTVLVRMAGCWGEETGGAGLFGVARADDPRDAGDPVAYPKETTFDAHYHDCDEYWIILEGRGTAASEGRLYEVGPGDCVATGMGHHHDFPLVAAPVRAVFFETTLEGQKRRGHLWNHTHGPAEPHPDRI
ncbi:MAG: cupin domain-containing protein [Thermomicrobiales bacterium]